MTYRWSERGKDSSKSEVEIRRSWFPCLAKEARHGAPHFEYSPDIF
jgi:hypothetical protein